MLNLFVFLCAFGCLTTSVTFANLLLIGNNTSLSFNAVPAKFGRPVTGSGDHGTIFLASPLDACSPLNNNLTKDTINSAFVLIIKGECEFIDQVRRAQDAGFKAAIVYNDKDGNLYPMRGNPTGIHIHAVLVTQSTGLKLKKYVGVKEIEVWLVEDDNSALAIMAVSFVALLAILAAIATCFFVRSVQVRRYNPRSRVRESRGMSIESVNAMRSLEFTEDLDDNCTSATCAICLYDYNVGDKLRILPCSHKFHMFCVDDWLTNRKTFCPICKRDVNSTITDPPPTERTPLLSYTPASVASSSSSLSSSARSSSYVSSRPMQIGRSPTSLSYTPRQSFSSYRESRYPSSGQSSLDIRNASSSYRSCGSHFNSNSFASPSLSPLNSIYTTFYSNSGNLSSSQQAQALLRRESAGKSPLEC